MELRNVSSSAPIIIGILRATKPNLKIIRLLGEHRIPSRLAKLDDKKKTLSTLEYLSCNSVTILPIEQHPYHLPFFIQLVLDLSLHHYIPSTDFLRVH